MVDSAELTRRSALGLIAGGGLLLASETMGYSSIGSDRIASVTPADDENAFISLVDANPTRIPNNDFETVANLENKLSDDVTVDYVISTNQDGVSIQFAGEQSDPGGTLSGEGFPLSDGEEIELECSNPGQIGDDELLTVELVAQSEGEDVKIEHLELNQEFTCRGGVLLVNDVRGLVDTDPSDADAIEAEIDIEETDGEETENLTVELTIVGKSEGEVYSVTKQAPDDFPEIQNEEITVVFDDIPELTEDEYEYEVVANADNANESTAFGDFVVDGDLLIIDLVAARGSARDLGIDALNRSGETLQLVAMAAEHDPDGDTSNRNRETFEELLIDVGGDGTYEGELGGQNDEQPGDGTRIDHDPVSLPDGTDAEYAMNDWDGSGNLNGEQFEITIWAENEDGVEQQYTERVTVE